jgi:hypothetical protein
VVAATLELPGSAYATLEVGAETYVQRKRTLVFDAGGNIHDEPRDRRDALDADAVLRSGLGVGVRW